MRRDQDETLEGWNRGLIYFRACVERSIGQHFKCRNTLIVLTPTTAKRPLMEIPYRILSLYNSYYWLDVVHKNSSCRLSVPSPVAASTHEEPGAWIDHFDR